MIDLLWTASREVSITRGKCNTCQHDISTYTSIHILYNVYILYAYYYATFSHALSTEYILYGCTLHLVFHKKTSGSLWSKSPFLHSLFHVSNAKKNFLALYHQSWCKNYTVLEVLRQINIIAKIDYTVYISLDSVPSLLRVYSISFYGFCKDLRIFG